MRSMKLYNSQECDWVKYAFGNNAMDYTRNLVDEGNGKSNLVCLLFSKSDHFCPVADDRVHHCSSCSCGLPAETALYMTMVTPTV